MFWIFLFAFPGLGMFHFLDMQRTLVEPKGSLATVVTPENEKLRRRSS
jgi:hypothetical protein